MKFVDGKLFLTINSTFSELKNYVHSNNEFQQAFSEFYLFEIYDSGSIEMAKEFESLTNEGSEQRIIDFFLRNKLLIEAQPTQEGDDLDIFFHTIFTE